MYDDEIPVNQAKDLRGLKFGKLKVLYRVKNPYGRKDSYWKCKCECGQLHIAQGSLLTRGNIKSCGCLKKDENTNKRISETLKGTPKKDLVGKKYGHLTVKKLLFIDKNRHYVYGCECDCGNSSLIAVSSSNLLSGHTISCGCIKSKGEKIISLIFSQNNIHFEKDKTFPTLRGEKNSYLRCDFFVQNTYVIEFDGIQHFTGWNNDENNLLIQQKRDEIKNQWCKDNNIPLIRIPYTKLNTLNIEDLMLETTQFRVV